MTNEIKEILDRLKRIDHKEYSCGFEFADSSSFNETARCFKERKMLAENITNLQEENARLLHIARKMHTWIFLNSGDEQKVYDEIGLTEKENIMLGYSGQIKINSGDDNEL